MKKSHRNSLDQRIMAKTNEGDKIMRTKTKCHITKFLIKVKKTDFKSRRNFIKNKVSSHMNVASAILRGEHDYVNDIHENNELDSERSSNVQNDNDLVQIPQENNEYNSERNPCKCKSIIRDAKKNKEIE